MIGEKYTTFVPCGILIIALVRISINCYFRFIHVGVRFYGLLEIDVLQRLGMNMFQQKILEICI
jgi:hypothetical protein